MTLNPSKNFLIDIGHANGTGARSLDRKYEEHALCTTIATHLAAILSSAGQYVRTIDFPNESNTADLNDTISLVNSLHNISAGVSLHMDAADSPSPHGAHVCYYSSTGSKLAAAIASPLCALLPGRAEHTVKRTNLAVLKRTKPTWVLCECGFITNPENCAFALDHPKQIAAAIAAGLASFYNFNLS